MAKIFSAKKDSERNPKKLKQRKCCMKKKQGTKIETEKTNRAICYSPDKPKTPAMERVMRRSHVSGGFWLGLNWTFCLDHLPHHDETFDLVVDGVDGKKWPVTYIANKRGLTGGWRVFSVHHGLLEGDILVFKLIEPHKFKVHIVRASEPTSMMIDHQPNMMTSATMHEEIVTILGDEVGKLGIQDAEVKNDVEVK